LAAAAATAAMGSFRYKYCHCFSRWPTTGKTNPLLCNEGKEDKRWGVGRNTTKPFTPSFHI